MPPEEIKNRPGEEEILRVERWIRQGIEAGAVRPSIDPACFAVEFNSFIFGIVYQWLANESAINLHTVFQHYRRSTIERLSVKQG